jgi:hypothetical protein
MLTGRPQAGAGQLDAPGFECIVCAITCNHCNVPRCTHLGMVPWGPAWGPHHDSASAMWQAAALGLVVAVDAPLIISKSLITSCF